MKIFAHRGYSGKYPENTMTAFQKASETAVDGIELDIQMTKDGELVIIHDEKVDRTTNGKGFVCDFTFEELEKLNANKIHSDTAEKEHIPSFEEYCEWVASLNCVTNVEFKTGVIYYPGIEEKALNIITKYGIKDRIFFSSRNPISITLIKKMDKSLKCGLLVEEPIINAGALCKTAGFEFYHPGLHFVTAKDIQECHKYGIKVNIWTTKNKADMTKVSKLNADGAFSNFPEF